MSDDQLTGLLRQAKAAQIPNHLNDAPDITQKFAFVAGVNEKPTVLDDASFDQYLKDNHIPRRDIPGAFCQPDHLLRLGRLHSPIRPKTRRIC